MKKIYFLRCLILLAFNLTQISVNQAIPGEKFYIINNTESALRIRIRCGAPTIYSGQGIQVILPDLKESTDVKMINNEVFELPANSSLWVNTPDETKHPLRIRVWPNNYTPQEDIDEKTSQPTETSEQNRKYCLNGGLFAFKYSNSLFHYYPERLRNYINILGGKNLYDLFNDFKDGIVFELFEIDKNKKQHIFRPAMSKDIENIILARKSYFGMYAQYTKKR